MNRYSAIDESLKSVSILAERSPRQPSRLGTVSRTTSRRTSIVRSHRPELALVDPRLDQLHQPLVFLQPLLRFLPHAGQLFVALTLRYVLDRLHRFVQLRLQSVDVSDEREATMMATQHPEILVSNRESTRRVELHLLHPVVARVPVDGDDKPVRILQPLRVDDDVDGVFVGGIVHVPYEPLVQRFHPRLVHQPVVELPPEGAFRRIDDVHLHVSQQRRALLFLQLGDLESEELLDIEAFHDLIGKGRVV